MYTKQLKEKGRQKDGTVNLENKGAVKNNGK
jgi:hypothetical protein